MVMAAALPVILPAVAELIQNSQNSTPVGASKDAAKDATKSASQASPLLQNIQAGAEIGTMIGNQLRGTQLQEPPTPAGAMQVQPTATQFMGRPGDEVGVEEILALLQSRR